MLIENILTPECTFSNTPGISKKRTLETISQSIANIYPAINVETLFTALINRERLGSTGIGYGIALPHCRLAACQQIIGSLVKLDKAVDYDSIDKQPVDILFMLLVPEIATEEHLQTLSMLVKRFKQVEYRKILRQSESSLELYHAAVNFRVMKT